MEGHRDKERLISIGRIIRPFGVRGEVGVEILTDFPDRFMEMESVLLVNEKTGAPAKPVRIQSARFHKKMVLLKLDVFDTPEDIEPYRGCFLKITADELKELSPDEYYIFDLIGIEVFDLDGVVIGNLTKVFSAGVHDVYEIQHPHSGKVNLIPAKKEFIKEVNIEERRMVVSPIEGLIEY